MFGWKPQSWNSEGELVRKHYWERGESHIHHSRLKSVLIEQIASIRDELASLRAENERLKAGVHSDPYAVFCEELKQLVDAQHRLKDRLAAQAAILDRVKHRTRIGIGNDGIGFEEHYKDCPACAWAKMKGEK